MMRKNLSYSLTLAVIASVLMHAGAAWFMQSLQEPKVDPPSVSVEIVPPVRAPGPTKAKSQASSNSQAVRKPSPQKVDLGLKITGKSLWDRYENIQDLKDSARGDFETALNPNSELSTSELRTYQDLWSLIDHSIENSQFLGEFNHVGTVRVLFRVLENGSLDVESFRACSPDSVLKVYAARAIRKALQKATDVHAAPYRMTANFHWTPNCDSELKIFREQLHFCRRTEALHQTFSAGEQTTSYLSALAYGPGALEEIEKYNRQKSRRNTKFDPYRNLDRDPDWNLSCED